MATTLTAPPQSSAPRWLLAAVAALAALAIFVGLSAALGSDSDAPAARSVPQVTQVIGSADSFDHAVAPEHVTRAEARRDAVDARSAEAPERRVPARAF